MTDAITTSPAMEERDRMDARRYRWLRAAMVTNDDRAIDALLAANPDPASAAEFDATIDRARAALAGH